MSSSPPKTVSVSLLDLSKMIDHSLLHPTLTDVEVIAGLELCKEYNVAAACIKPCHIPLALHHLRSTSIAICAVIGFPHGNSTTEVKVFEARRAAEDGATEIDMVINIGKALSDDWTYVEDEIRAVNEAVTERKAILKVIFENDYLTPPQIQHLSTICSRVPVAYIKTSTGYGFVKQASGDYNYMGATHAHLKLMRQHAAPGVKIKAAGGVRTLDDLLRVRVLGVDRVGATATKVMLEDAKRRGIEEEKSEVDVPPFPDEKTEGGK